MIDYGFDPKIKYIIGVDEVGWGAIAGPIEVGGCVVRVEDDLEWLDIKDSKRYYTETARANANDNLRRAAGAKRLDTFTWSANALFVSQDPAKALKHCQSVVIATLLDSHIVEEPDAVGVIVDGNICVNSHVPVRTVPKADNIYKVVAAASVAAKVYRDSLMMAIHTDYEQKYEFNKNKGYPTARHIELLNQHGPCAEHRTNIALVRNAMK